VKIIETAIPEVLLIEPDVFEDNRGFLLETWNRERYIDAGFPDVAFVQDNHSRSRKGVLRGLHFQLKHPQGKLVQVVTGTVFDVAVDIRVGSPTFGQWVGFELSEDNHRQVWTPSGFAHGFCALSDVVNLTYKCTDLYHPEDQGGVLWNDPEIGIAWPLEESLLSKKDLLSPVLALIPENKLPGYS